MGDDLLVYSASGARLFSVSGVEYLTESVLLTTPVADGAGSAAVVYDAGGYALRVLSDRSTVLETSAAQGHEILSARLNAAGRLTVTSREPVIRAPSPSTMGLISRWSASAFPAGF